MKQEKIDEYLKKLEEINKNEHKDYSIDVETITRANEKAKFFVTYNNEKIEFEMTPHNFFNNGHRLPKGLRRRRSQEEYEKKVFDLVQDEYEVIGRYTGSTKKLKSNTINAVEYTKSLQMNSYREKDVLNARKE